jgi:hypothetical protein
MAKVAFEYNGDLTLETYKEFYRYGNFEKLPEDQLEWILENSKWKYQAVNMETGETVCMARALADELSTVVITDIVVHPDWHYESAHFAQTMVDKFVDFFLDCLEENDKLKVILTNMDEWSYQELSKTFEKQGIFLSKTFTKK